QHLHYQHSHKENQHAHPEIVGTCEVVEVQFGCDSVKSNRRHKRGDEGENYAAPHQHYRCEKVYNVQKPSQKVSQTEKRHCQNSVFANGNGIDSCETEGETYNYRHQQRSGNACYHHNGKCQPKIGLSRCYHGCGKTLLPVGKHECYHK